MKPLLLDTFCGAGGCSKGYVDAGFDVVGVDINPQPRYPYEFHQGDALEFIAKYGKEFDVIHASPPCQEYSALKAVVDDPDYPDLVEATRKELIKTDKPYIIENVEGAPLINPVMLCGSMFGLRVRRHRLFESTPVIWFPPASCNHLLKAPRTGRKPNSSQFYSVVGHFSDVKGAGVAMGCEWMGQKEMSQAIPPAYTKWVGEQLMPYVLGGAK